MEYIYNGNSKSAGIYKITNKLNGRRYFGSAKCFQVRWSQHANSLKRGKHQNKFLQADFNKCGEDAFVFEVLEVMTGTKEERLAREEVFLGEHFDKGTECYNLMSRAVSREGFASKNPEETRRKISEASKSNWKDPEYKERVSKSIREALSDPETQKKKQEGHLRSWKDNEERRAKRSEHSKKLMTDPEYKAKVMSALFEGQPKGRETFRERMKEDSALKEKYALIGKEKAGRINEKYQVDPEFKKKMDAHSSHNIREYNRQKMENAQVKPPIISPDGAVYNQIKNLALFAKEHGLDPSALCKLYLGKLKSVRGWKLLKTPRVT